MMHVGLLPLLYKYTPSSLRRPAFLVACHEPTRDTHTSIFTKQAYMLWKLPSVCCPTAGVVTAPCTAALNFALAAFTRYGATALYGEHAALFTPPLLYTLMRRQSPAVVVSLQCPVAKERTTTQKKKKAADIRKIHFCGSAQMKKKGAAYPRGE